MRLDSDVYDRIEQIAASKDMTITKFVNAIVTVMLRREIDRLEREKIKNEES